MSTNKTQNYQLNQWVKSDAVLMEEFNADNAKIDAALASKASTSALSDLQSVVSGKASTASLHAVQTKLTAQGTELSLRNCRFVTGSYTGTGKYGQADANTLTFSQRPVFLHVAGNGGTTLDLIAGQNSTFVSSSSSSNSTLTVTWSTRSVSWYVSHTTSTSSAPYHQMNDSGTYHYFALLEIE